MKTEIRFESKDYYALCEFIKEALEYFREEDITEKDIGIIMPQYMEYAFEYFLRGQLYNTFNQSLFYINNERKKYFFGQPIDFTGYENKVIVYWKDWHNNTELKHQEFDLTNCLKTI